MSSERRQFKLPAPRFSVLLLNFVLFQVTGADSDGGGRPHCDAPASGYDETWQQGLADDKKEGVQFSEEIGREKIKIKFFSVPLFSANYLVYNQ